MLTEVDKLQNKGMDLTQTGSLSKIKSDPTDNRSTASNAVVLRQHHDLPLQGGRSKALASPEVPDACPVSQTSNPFNDKASFSPTHASALQSTKPPTYATNPSAMPPSYLS
jgi:hypothetical protein